MRQSQPHELESMTPRERLGHPPNGITSLGVCYAPQGAIASANIGPTGGSTWLKAAMSYNDRLQSNQIQYLNQAGNLMQLQYSFVDASSHNNGNVMGITNLVDGTRSQQFTYDQLNRLFIAETTSNYSTSPTHCWGETYVYDNVTTIIPTATGEFGNLTNINVASTAYNGCTQESLSVLASATNQITTFSYDASGNTLNDTHNSYTWNAESEIKTAAGVTYTYDGDGDRLQKSTGKIYWYGAGSEILDESDSSGNITDEYVFFGGKRVAHRVVSGNVISYYGEDFLGSSRQIYTSASALCYDADFYPFGGERTVTNTCVQNYKFEGKERDTETNNDDFGARYYSSSFGRWTSPDWSAIPAPVPYANLTNPQTLNLYAMVSDNPETFADLDGHLGGIGGPVVEPSYCASSSDGSCSDPSHGKEEEDYLARNNTWETVLTATATLNLGGITVDITFSAYEWSDGNKGMTIDAFAEGCGSCGWAQTVTKTGSDAHEAQTDREAKSGAQPLYPSGYHRGGGDAQNFSDTPTTHKGGSGTFTAVTSLGVANMNAETFRILGSMTWGYTLSKSGTVTLSAPRVATRAEQDRSVAALKRDSPAWKITQ